MPLEHDILVDPSKTPRVSAVGGGIVHDILVDSDAETVAQAAPTVEEFGFGDTLGYAGRLAKRTGGMILGLGAAFPSVLFGGFNVRDLDPEQYDALPFWRKALVELGGAFDSAREAIFEEGKWGTLWSDYYRETNKESVWDTLHRKFKNAGSKDPVAAANLVAPTVEFLGDFIGDPAIPLGAAATIAKLRVPKGLVGQIPERVEAAIAFLDKQELKKQIKEVLTDAAKTKEDTPFLVWRERQIGAMKRDLGILHAGKQYGRMGQTDFEQNVLRKMQEGKPKVELTQKPTYPFQDLPYIKRASEAKTGGKSAMQFIDETRAALGIPDAGVYVRDLPEFTQALGAREFGRPTQTISDAVGWREQLDDLYEAARHVWPEGEVAAAFRSLELDEGAKRARGVKDPVPAPVKTPGKMFTPQHATYPWQPKPGELVKTKPFVKGVKPAPYVSEGAVPETFKQLKVGQTVPGIGKINEIVETKTGNFWVRYIDETGEPKLKKLETVLAEMKAGEPSVTLDSLGLQQMFEKLQRAIKKLSVDPPFQQQIPDLKTPDMTQVVKKRKLSKGLTAPPIFGLERNIVMRMNELSTSAFQKHFQNPIRIFEELGAPVKELFYRPIKVAEKAAALEKQKHNAWLRGLKKTVPFKSREKIGLYALSERQSGTERLSRQWFRKEWEALQKQYPDPKKLSTTQRYAYDKARQILMARAQAKIPKWTDLSGAEQKVYTEMRAQYKDFYNRLSQARVASGKDAFPSVNNYFTFVHDLSVWDKMGKSAMAISDEQLAKYIHPKTTIFPYAKGAKVVDLENLPPLETDVFRIFDAYMPSAVDHIQLSPRIAKLNELLGEFKDPISGAKWTLSQTHPIAFQFLREWLDFQSGMTPTSTFLKGKAANILAKLNRNMTYAVLSGNIRSALIQGTAIVRAEILLGPKYTLKGIGGLFKEGTGFLAEADLALKKSNHLISRQFDVSYMDAFDAVRGKRGAAVRTMVGKGALKPLQIFDMVTAKAVWYGAYKRGREVMKLSDDLAINYADDVVIKTQASASRSDISRVQRYAEGRALTMFQTFVINDWNLLVKDVFGWNNPRIATLTKFRRIVDYIVGTTLVNVLYEDGMNMNSPFPTPIRAFREALEEGESLPSASGKVMMELLEPLPIVGGPVRYGGEFGGPLFQTAKEGVNIIRGKYDFPTGLGKATEMGGRLVGIPGTAQAARAGRARARGEESIWPYVAGKPTEYTGGSPGGGIGGISGIGGI